MCARQSVFGPARGILSVLYLLNTSAIGYVALTVLRVSGYLFASVRSGSFFNRTTMPGDGDRSLGQVEDVLSVSDESSMFDSDNDDPPNSFVSAGSGGAARQGNAEGRRFNSASAANRAAAADPGHRDVLELAFPEASGTDAGLAQSLRDQGGGAPLTKRQKISNVHTADAKLAELRAQLHCASAAVQDAEKLVRGDADPEESKCVVCLATANELKGTIGFLNCPCAVCVCEPCSRSYGPGTSCPACRQLISSNPSTWRRFTCEDTTAPAELWGQIDAANTAFDAALECAVHDKRYTIRRSFALAVITKRIWEPDKLPTKSAVDNMRVSVPSSSTTSTFAATTIEHIETLGQVIRLSTDSVDRRLHRAMENRAQEYFDAEKFAQRKIRQQAERLNTVIDSLPPTMKGFTKMRIGKIF